MLRKTNPDIMEAKELIIEKVKSQFGDAILETSDFRNDLTLVIDPNKNVEIARFLRDDQDLQFAACKDVTAIDWATRKNRFTVVYHLYSLKLKLTLRVKATIADASNPQIESLTPVWNSANWYERETWDMYGIKFLNHPDLRRMYMPEEFEYFPLRKEFPVLGIPGSIPLPKRED